MRVTAEERSHARGHWPRSAYLVLAWVFFAGVLVQVFLAGRAVFESSAYWGSHRSFVHYVELLPVVMVVVALLGRAPRGQGLYGLPICLFALTFLQYFTANVRLPVVSALHPVNALLIFAVATLVIRRTGSWQVNPQESRPGGRQQATCPVEPPDRVGEV